MSFPTIKKRDGRQVPFNAEKITLAIAKAGQATGEFGLTTARELTARTIELAEAELAGNMPEVERIQDIVENVLLDTYRITAKAYILYREQRAQMRALASKANSELDLVDCYLSRLDWRIKENSNMGFSLQGLNNFISSDITSEYWLNRIYPSKIREAHRSGDLHLHDLNQLSVYCVGWDLMDLLRVGFKGIAGNIGSAPPKHFHTALGQLVNFFYTLQGEAAGAQAVSSFDTLLAPFIRYDGLSYRDVYQALQGFVFNINIATRVGFQTPFTNITLDLSPSSIYRDTPVIIGGCDMPETYGDFQAEMNTFNKAFAEVMMAGDTMGRCFTFPIPTYSVDKNFNWDNPALDSIWRMTGRYGIPYFSNFINSDMSPDDARSMCCRLRLDNRELHKRGGGLFGANPLTGSIGVVTLNLPRLGYLSANEDDFLNRLDRLINLAAESLDIKRKELERFTEGGLYPYTMFYLRSVREHTGKYWANHFSTIGIVGANEACLNLLDQDIASEAGSKFGLKILNHMRQRLAELQEKTGQLFNLEATPAEGTSYRLARLDQERYKGMIFANGSLSPSEPSKKISFTPFYTNSTHLPVNHSDDLFECLELQDPLQCLYTGGTVIHAFIGEEISDPNLVKSLVRKIASSYKLPYFTLTPTFSICSEHGYITGEHHVCPTCEAETDVYSRVVGYLRPVGRWNEGKRAEFSLRKTYNTELATRARLQLVQPQAKDRPDLDADKLPWPTKGQDSIDSEDVEDEPTEEKVVSGRNR
ncbi:MAG: ribonucleoside triphosphate reductase [Deltaproteobacteria bacterium]|jgi:ribonucleoside-triphosphate reductase|nr:ribonucleoside triphosphate reductase [Deltaproteobacteria bacterium]